MSRRDRRADRGGGRPHRHPRQQCRHRRQGGGPQDHRRIPGRDLGRDAAHRSHRRLPGEPRRRPAHEGAEASGRIINIASVLGLVPMRLQSSYVAAKAGVVNLTRSMALELAPHGILVNGIAPGSTATEGWKQWINDAKSEELDLHARLMSHIPLGRPATTQEIAQRRAVPRGPGELLHHRPHPSHRRRLDRRLRAGFLSNEPTGRRHRTASRSEPDRTACRCPTGSTPDQMVGLYREHGAAAEVRACRAGRLPQGRDAGLPAPLYRRGGDRRRRLRASASRPTGSPRPIAATAMRSPRAWTRAC